MNTPVLVAQAPIIIGRGPESENEHGPGDGERCDPQEIEIDQGHLPRNFHLISTKWTAEAIAALIEACEAARPPGAWPNWVLGNHDRPRVASRLGPDQARVAAMLLLTLRGTPTLYQGEEIGMTDAPIPSGRVQDPWERDVRRRETHLTSLGS